MNWIACKRKDKSVGLEPLPTWDVVEGLVNGRMSRDFLAYSLSILPPGRQVAACSDAVFDYLRQLYPPLKKGFIEDFGAALAVIASDKRGAEKLWDLYHADPMWSLALVTVSGQHMKVADKVYGQVIGFWQDDPCQSPPDGWEIRGFPDGTLFVDAEHAGMAADIFVAIQKATEEMKGRKQH